MADTLGKMYVQIAADASKLVNEVGKAQKSLSNLEFLANRLKYALLSTFGAGALISAIKSNVMILAEFDKAMNSVRVITGASVDEFNQLEKSAISLGSSTQFTAKQVAELQLEFGRLGFSTKEILQSTKATVDLATATGESLARSAEIAGSTLRAFQMDASQMGRVTDIMASSLNRSALTLDTFADAIKYVSPVAKATGVSLEETAAMMSVLADAGIKGSQAGTSLRRIFTLLTKDGRPLQERLAELSAAGITLAGANDEVGLYAQTALLQLTAMLPRVNELTESYKNNSGAVNVMAREMEKNLATSITKVGTAWDALIISFKGSKGVLSYLFDDLSRKLRRMADDDLELFRLSLENLQKSLRGGFLFGNTYSVTERQIEGLQEKAQKAGKEIMLTWDETGKVIKGIFEISEVGGANAPNPSTTNTGLLNIIGEYNTKITAEKAKQLELDKEAKAELEKQNAEYQKILDKQYELSELQREARIATLERSQAAPRKEGLAVLPTLDSNISFDTSGIASMAEAYSNLSDKVAAFGLNLNFAGEAQKSQIESWQYWGNVVSNVIDNVIAKDQDIAKSAAETTARIIDASKERIATYLVEAASKAATALPGPVALVTLGLSLVSGLLKKFAKTGGDTYTRPSAASTRSSVSGGSQNSVQFVIKGQDLYGSLSNYQRNNGLTSFVGG